MGLLQLLMPDSDAAKWAGSNSGFLGALGGGLASKGDFGDRLGAAASALPAGKAYDQSAQQQLDTQNKTAAALHQMGYDDLIPWVQAGQAGAAVAEAFRRRSAKTAGPIEINGQLVDPSSYKVLGDYRTPETTKSADLPTSFKEWQLAQENPDYAKTLNSTTSKPPTEQVIRNRELASVVNPQLDIALNNFDALADGGNQAWGSNPVTYGIASPEYQQAKNAITTIAQSYLYSVSGAAATDAETKKIVDSVTPLPFESEKSRNDKKARLKFYVDAINKTANATGGASPGGVDDLLTKYGVQ